MADRMLGDRSGARVATEGRDHATTRDLDRILWARAGVEDRSWRRLAACADLDPGVFFPVGTTGAAVVQIASAKAVCHRCPVRLACLQFALVTHQEDGVWGGHSEEERRELRRKWRRLGRPLRIVHGSVRSDGGRVAVAPQDDLAPEAG